MKTIFRTFIKVILSYYQFWFDKENHYSNSTSLTSMGTLALLMLPCIFHAQTNSIVEVRSKQLHEFTQSLKPTSAQKLMSTPLQVATIYGCQTPALGVFDVPTGTVVATTIPCDYPQFIYIRPTSYFLAGNVTTAPCMKIETSVVPANAQSNNSVNFLENGSPFVSFCPTCAVTFSSNVANSLATGPFSPTLPHTVQICNINPSSAFNYTISSCYNNTPLALGTYFNNTANNCVNVPIAANLPIGLVSFSVVPTIPTTAYGVASWGAITLDTYQMAAGNYTVSYFFDSQSGCTTVSTIVLTITNPYSANWTTPIPLCNNSGCIGLTSQVSGTSGGVFNGTGVSGSFFCPSTSGVGNFPVTYSVGITPTCKASVTNTITVNAAPSATATGGAVLNCTNTAITLSGFGSGSYSWLGAGIVSGGNTANPVVNQPGTYSLIVTDVNNCKGTASTTVTQNIITPTFNLTSANSITTSCSSPNATLSASSSSDPNTVYTWLTPNNTTLSGSSVVVSIAGTYTAYVTNTTNGCSTLSSPTTVQVVSGSAIPSVTLSANTVSITCSSPTASVSASVNPTTASYTWSPASGISSGINTANPVFNTAGTYSLVVTNTANNCSTNSSNNIVTVAFSATAPIANIAVLSSNTVLGCGNYSTVTLVVNTTPTTCTNIWMPSGATTNSLICASAGVYTVSVFNPSNGCSSNTQYTITNNTTNLTYSISNSATIPCGTNSVTLLAASTNTNISFYWYGTTAVTNSNSASPTVTSVGSYTVVAIDLMTQCSTSSVVSVYQGSITANFTASPNNGLPPLDVTYTNLTAPINASYVWAFGNGNTSTSISPQNTFVASGTYSSVLIATLGNCTDTAVVTILVEVNLIIPNFVTPNSDGKNDVLVITGLKQYPNNTLEIYNRWGSLVYLKKGYNNDWGGMPNQPSMGSGLLPSGTYFIILDFGKESTTKPHKGYIELKY